MNVSEHDVSILLEASGDGTNANDPILSPAMIVYNAKYLANFGRELDGLRKIAARCLDGGSDLQEEFCNSRLRYGLQNGRVAGPTGWSGIEIHLRLQGLYRCFFAVLSKCHNRQTRLSGLNNNEPESVLRLIRQPLMQLAPREAGVTAGDIRRQATTCSRVSVLAGKRKIRAVIIRSSSQHS
jgi:hypothetical protein